MSNVERRLAENILKFVSPKQAETVETENPGFALQVKALSRHMTGDVSDEQFAFREIAIKALVQSMLHFNYQGAYISYSLDDIYAQFDRMTTNCNLVIGSLPYTNSMWRPANRREQLFNSLKEEMPSFREDLG